MIDWKSNAIMYWSLNGTTWQMITDHNRAPIDISVERFEKSNRMHDGTLRRYTISKKHTFNVSWTSLPKNVTSVFQGRTGLGTVDGGLAAAGIESWHDANDGPFWIQLRSGQDDTKPSTDNTIEKFKVMITDFSKTIVSRGVNDFWDITITLEEV